MLDGDLPPKKGLQPPTFQPVSPNGWMDQDATWYEVGLGPDYIVLDGDRAPPERGTAAPPTLAGVVVKWLDGSRCHLVQR